MFLKGVGVVKVMMTMMLHALFVKKIGIKKKKKKRKLGLLSKTFFLLFVLVQRRGGGLTLNTS